MNFYETLLDKAEYTRAGIHVIDTDEAGYAWTVEWDERVGAFWSQVTLWDNPDENPVSESAFGISRADAAEQAMNSFLLEVHRKAEQRQALTAEHALT